jgi:hypothetical protein
MAEIPPGERQTADHDAFFRDDSDPSKAYRRVSDPVSQGILADILTATGGAGVEAGSILAGIQFDEYLTSYPSPAVEVTVYKLLSVTQATVTVTWTDDTKEFHVSTVRT